MIPTGLFKNDYQLWHEVHRAGALDLTSDGTVHFGGYASHLAGKDTTGFGGKLGENLGVLVADLFKGKVETLGGHRLVVLAEVDPALDGLGLRHNKRL